MSNFRPVQILLATLLMAACSAEPTPAPTPAGAADETAIAEVPVPEPALVPAPTPAPSPAPPPAPSASAVAPAQGETQDLAWLHGTWELTYDPDDGPKDRMVFAEGGTLKIQDMSGKTAYEGTYSLEGSELALSVTVSGRIATLTAVVSPERDRLTNDSGAYYTRLP